MTTVSVLAAPPADADLVDRLAKPPIDRSGAIALYEAMLVDVCRAVERSGADLVVVAVGSDGDDRRSRVWDPVADGLEAPDAVELRQRDGPDREELLAAEVLRLHEAGATSAAVVEPSVPFLERTTVDGASMKLRSSDVVLGPASRGRVYFAGFAEPIDVRGHFEPTPLEGLAELAGEDRAVDFLPMVPTVETAGDLPSAVAHLRARVAAGRRVPRATATAVADLGLAVTQEEGSLVLVEEGTEST